MTTIRSRWAALGAAVAVTLGGGGIAMVSATDPAEAVTFVPITPCRVADTRPNSQVGQRSAPLGPGDIHDVSAIGQTGECDVVPAGATAVSLNVTTVDATEGTFLTIWATGEEQPNASSLNPSPGQPPTPNAVTTPLSDDGEFSIYNLAGNVHVIADINGYYTDHNHDDRYYTRAEVNSIVDSIRVTHVFEGGPSVAGGIFGATIVKTATISTPRAGVVVANGSVQVSPGSPTPADEIICGLSLDGFTDAGQRRVVSTGAHPGLRAMAMTREFEVVSRAMTVNLVCQNTGIGSDTSLASDPTISLTYIPD